MVLCGRSLPVLLVTLHVYPVSPSAGSDVHACMWVGSGNVRFSPEHVSYAKLELVLWYMAHLRVTPNVMLHECLAACGSPSIFKLRHSRECQWLPSDMLVQHTHTSVFQDLNKVCKSWPLSDVMFRLLFQKKNVTGRQFFHFLPGIHFNENTVLPSSRCFQIKARKRIQFNVIFLPFIKLHGSNTLCMHHKSTGHVHATPAIAPTCSP